MRFISILCLISLTACGGGSYANPDYKVIRNHDDFELREYAARIVAETTVAGTFEESGNTAFRILAGYIGGKNEGSRKIEMTAPVNRQPVTPSPEIEISSDMPVDPRPDDNASSNKVREYLYQFFMPGEWTMETLPEPTDERVTLRELPAQRYAAIRFSGRWSWENFERHREKLQAAMKRHGFEPARDTPIYACYNAPFTPPFMRRNEVLLKLKDESGEMAANAEMAK